MVQFLKPKITNKEQNKMIYLNTIQNNLDAASHICIAQEAASKEAPWFRNIFW